MIIIRLENLARKVLVNTFEQYHHLLAMNATSS